ncbi:transporter, major facilitator family protein [Leptospira inadai serovar Lyme str. 10]|uniref:Transporter, major facilitator family protein n=2 Tax=Leptospira inadai serovar Lyme TaxID=293084 RepID=V6HB42_9LEPT|nr:MFS transporter [Leptospira inadai]EQA35753.1 transporter, major facilitator family protein [Leptospira inadai serovar Lyme str. 10]PNV76855.1 MFS transporter [Leptospira inadai serovar Lyme]
MNQNTPPKAGSREWIGLAVIALPCLLYAMDLTVLYLAVPNLTAELKPTSSQLLWIVDIYGFLVAGFLITMGTLGDRIGRRKLLLIGAGAFGLASVLAAFSTSAEMLIGTRALLGITAATLAPSTLSLIRNMFLDPNQRTVAIGIWGTSFSIGGAIGPVVGGLLLEHFWWGSVFLLSVPVMAVLLIVGPKLLPEFRDPNAGKLDIFSAVLSLASVLSIIYGLKQIAENGWGLLPVLPILIGLVFGFLFVRRQQTLADPLLDLTLFRIPAFTGALIANTLTIFVGLGTFLFIAQYLQLVLGFSPLEAGLWTLPSAAGNVVGSMTVPILVRHIRPAFVMVGGLVLSALGLLLYAQVNGTSGLPYIVCGSIVLALGICSVVILGTDIIVSAAPPERAGAAASISETGAEFGGVLGIAVLGSVGTVIYRNQMKNSALIGMSPDAAEDARNTLGAAVGIAKELPDQIGTVLLGLAREAFTDSLQVIALICFGLTIILAITVVLALRSMRKGEGT